VGHVLDRPAITFLTSALDGDKWSLYRWYPLNIRLDRPPEPVWMLWRRQKFCAPTMIPQSSNPQPSHYTDYIVMVLYLSLGMMKVALNHTLFIPEENE